MGSQFSQCHLQRKLPFPQEVNEMSCISWTKLHIHMKFSLTLLHYFNLLFVSMLKLCSFNFCSFSYILVSGRASIISLFSYVFVAVLNNFFYFFYEVRLSLSFCQKKSYNFDVYCFIWLRRNLYLRKLFFLNVQTLQNAKKKNGIGSIFIVLNRTFLSLSFLLC